MGINYILATALATKTASGRLKKVAKAMPFKNFMHYDRCDYLKTILRDENGVFQFRTTIKPRVVPEYERIYNSMLEEEADNRRNYDSRAWCVSIRWLLDFDYDQMPRDFFGGAMKEEGSYRYGLGEEYFNELNAIENPDDTFLVFNLMIERY